MTATNDLTKLTKDFLKLNKTAVRSLKAKDKIYLPDEKGQVDLNGLFGTGSNDNGNNSDDTGNGTIPDSGLNIDPGTSLSGVEQLWTGPASTVSDTEITLSKEISAIGDGLQLQLQIVKTPITGGKPGATSILPVVASNEAKPQEGKYVASVPIPISILAKNLAVGKTINCAIDGIGEALATTKVSQSPVISIYVKDSKTLVVTNHQGFALDQKSGSNNGAFYDGQVTSANSFTKEKPVATLPNGSTLFTGSAKSGEVKLSGVTDSWSNIADGILVYFSDKIIGSSTNVHDTYYVKSGDCITFDNPLLISKDLLKKGNTVTLPVKQPSTNPIQDYALSNNSKSNTSKINDSAPGIITINSNSISFKTVYLFFVDTGNEMNGAGSGFNIVKVTAYSK